MLREALQYVVQLAAPTEIKRGECLYTDKKMYPLGIEERPQIVHLSTLGSLAHYASLIEPESAMLLIGSETAVSLMDVEPDAFGQHVVYANATSLGNPFLTGVFVSAEPFIINFAQHFKPVEDFAYVLDLVSHLTAERVVNTADDGLSQTVGTRRGVVARQKADVRSRVKLAPYRTFREIEDQPVSEFLLRLKDKGEDELPAVGLFESDGDTWRIQARISIAAYLQVKCESHQVDIPVVW